VLAQFLSVEIQASDPGGAMRPAVGGYEAPG